MGLESTSVIYTRLLTEFTRTDKFNESKLKELQDIGYFKDIKFNETLTDEMKDDIILVADYLLHKDIDLNVQIEGKEIKWSKLIQSYLDNPFNRLIAPNMFKSLSNNIVELINICKGEKSKYGELIEVVSDWDNIELIEYAITYMFTNSFINSDLLDRMADIYERYDLLQLINYAGEFDQLNTDIMIDCIKVGQSFEEIVNGLDLPMFKLEEHLNDNIMALPFDDGSEKFVYLVVVTDNRFIFKVSMNHFVMMYEKDYLKTLTVKTIPSRLEEGRNVLSVDLPSLIVRTTDGSDKSLQSVLDINYVFKEKLTYD